MFAAIVGKSSSMWATVSNRPRITHHGAREEGPQHNADGPSGGGRWVEPRVYLKPGPRRKSTSPGVFAFISTDQQDARKCRDPPRLQATPLRGEVAGSVDHEARHAEYLSPARPQHNANRPSGETRGDEYSLLLPGCQPAVSIQQFKGLERRQEWVRASIVILLATEVRLMYRIWQEDASSASIRLNPRILAPHELSDRYSNFNF